MIRLSREQVRAVDRIAIEEYGIPGIVLMENAARSAVEAMVRRYPSIGDQSVAIVCGSGNNGGDGYAVARLLTNLGCHVDLVELTSSPGAEDARTNRDIAMRMKIDAVPIQDIESVEGGIDLWIDAVFGTGLTRAPEMPVKQAIEVMNQSRLPIVAIDLPSGLDCDTGLPLGDACVKADLTVTFVAEKLGFANRASRAYTGEVVVGDIGCPRAIIDRLLRT